MILISQRAKNVREDVYVYIADDADEYIKAICGTIRTIMEITEPDKMEDDIKRFLNEFDGIDNDH